MSRRRLVGRFRDESFQAITCTGTDNSKPDKRKYTKNKINKQSSGNKNMQNMQITFN